MIHVYLATEYELHELTGTMCPCGARVDFGNDGEMVVVHTPFDCLVLLQAAENVKAGYSCAEGKRGASD